jgi:secreted trypsin-like serine protease
MADALTVLAGTHVLSAGGERRQVFQYFVHPRYNEENYENDIAILEVSSTCYLRRLYYCRNV